MYCLSQRHVQIHLSQGFHHSISGVDESKNSYLPASCSGIAFMAYSDVKNLKYRQPSLAN